MNTRFKPKTAGNFKTEYCNTLKLHNFLIIYKLQKKRNSNIFFSAVLF